LGDLPKAGDESIRGRDMARLEAVLFMARGSLNSRKLAQFAGLADGTQARTLIRRLNELYDREGSAFRVEEVAGGFQLMTRPCFAPWLRRMHSMSVEVRLSTPAMETLAVIAYRQPVMRSELEAVRGVQCGEMLRQLNERDLVRIVGRSPELGRPFLYGTTRKFLQVFGLRSLEELPGAARFGSAARPGLPSVSPTSSEESHVKIAILPQSASEKDMENEFEENCLLGNQTPIAPRADAELEDDEADIEEDEVEDDDDEEDDLEDDELEDDDWEEVEDDDDEDWEEDDDWDEDEDDDEDWDDEEEE
jgi:segregation and condensation protein B